MDLDLRTLFSLEDGQTKALEFFISGRLFEAGLWNSWRSSDGIQYLRVVQCEPACVRVCGRIYEVRDQSLHIFWLDLKRATSGTGVRWTLYFDAPAPTNRHERDAIYMSDRAEDFSWAFVLAGDAQVRDGTLVVTLSKNP